MRWRLLAFVSLGVNLALAAGWLLVQRQLAARRSDDSASAGAGSLDKTNVVVRRQFFSWRDLESDDYPTYIANLRDIGCPDQTIRDIIIADVNALFSRRLATELVTAEQQWWRTEPDTNIVQVAAEKSRTMDEERRALLVRLLGPNWEYGDIVNLPRPSRPGVLLDGPVLGTLPADVKQAVEEVTLRSQDKMQAYVDAQRREGKSPDPVELAKLRAETRKELERVLAPGQLEEFLLRYSQNANQWRAKFGELRFFNPTPDEFRAAFRSTDIIDEQLQLLPPGNDPNTVAQRKSLEIQRENALKLALGPKRYEEYRLLQDPLYREAVATAQQNGAPETAWALYQINFAAASEADRIRNDPTLTPEQKAIELKRLELEQLKANTVAAGQELPPEPTTESPAPPKKTHLVRQGDTIGLLALLYGVSPSVIKALNPNVDFGRLKPGESIVVPRSGPPTAPGWRSECTAVREPSRRDRRGAACGHRRARSEHR